MDIVETLVGFFKKPTPTDEERDTINRLKECLRGPLPDDVRAQCEKAVFDFYDRYGLPRPNLKSLC